MISNNSCRTKELSSIEEEIERVRLVLNAQVGISYKRCLDPEVIELSQHLDKLLNDYMKLNVN
ncbi:aspartyl-phosphate phosphatase Spo0E family protein [Clostridium grantii]|uniref:Spo0E like sporulation regulatory protein n=1 Tax=Clostridium grantii DSM 8605 TaxID=1121316 RepID=A0A1M5UNR0_9CLOT|nr:aspartyl-phosphate phosphatase Spo0E family protein [Clostridium grantii]SHH64488.1 Spo0E like sporulation regulatory protein [Clostridium grantii DSM 8605]